MPSSTLRSEFTQRTGDDFASVIGMLAVYQAAIYAIPMRQENNAVKLIKGLPVSKG
jgi:hypothetical protein